MLFFSPLPHASLPLKPPPALRRPQATAALSSLQLGVPGGTTLLVKLTLTAAATVDTPVALSTDDPTATLPASVTVPAGASFVRFSVQTKNPLARRFLLVRATLAGVSRVQQITLEPAWAAPTVTGFFAADGVTLLSHALPGTPFLIRGSGLGTTPGRVVFDPTGAAKLSQWTDTQVTGTVPDPGDGPRVHETVQLALPAATAFLPVAPDFTIDGVPPPPAPPGVHLGRVLGSNGLFLTAPPSDGKLDIRGSGFGTRPGRVLYSGILLTVVSWSDTQIVALLPALPPGSPSSALTVQRADGLYYSSAPVWRPAGFPRER